MLANDTYENCVTETTSDFEIFVTIRTLKDNLVHCRREESDDRVAFMFDASDGSDIIIHIFESDDNPEEYLRIRSGMMVTRKHFMYTNKYVRCVVMPNGMLKKAYQ